MNENETKTGGPGRFFEEKGFYIILFLCVAAIGIAGYVLFVRPDTAAQPDTEPSSVSAPDDPETAQTVIPGRENAYGAILPPIPDPTPQASSGADEALEVLQPSAGLTPEQDEPKAEPEPAAPPEKPAPAPAAQEKPAQEKPAAQDAAPAAPTFFVRPVAGDAIRQFCVTELVYDRTMGDWRTHNGTDYAAVTGETVAAVADGTVTAIETDEFYGTIVVISHGGALESRYCGLAEQPCVKVGDPVLAGDVIGSVGAGAHFESLEPVHLHLEMTKDGAYIDPASLLPQA